MSTFPPSTSTNAPSRPIVLLLSLEKESFWDEIYSNFVDALAAKATIKRAAKPQGAYKYLSNNQPSAIILTDPALARGESILEGLEERIVTYVCDGGTVVLATLFSSFIGPLELSHWFRTSWHLPWQSGDYHRITVHLNAACQLRQSSQAELAGAYSQKALFLKNVVKGDAVYLPSPNSRIQLLVFSPTPVDCEQTPVAFAKVGEGWLGYMGDVNNEADSRPVILAMCGL